MGPRLRGDDELTSASMHRSPLRSPRRDRFDDRRNLLINPHRIRPLLLQPRVIARRWRHRRGRGMGRDKPADKDGNRQRHHTRSFHSAAPIARPGRFGGFILRDGASRLLRMRSEFLMVRSAATPRVSNHEATEPTRQHVLPIKTAENQPRICSGDSPGEPLPSASALRISATMRCDSGASSPRRSAMPVMTPCR
jgi:hypothetical protein